MTRIRSESELPTPPREEIPDKPGQFRPGQFYYVRFTIDPRVLIHGTTGECFVRNDGKRWEQPAYKTNRNPDGSADLKNASAYAGHKTYPYVASEAA